MDLDKLYRLCTVCDLSWHRQVGDYCWSCKRRGEPSHALTWTTSMYYRPDPDLADWLVMDPVFGPVGPSGVTGSGL